MRIMMKVINVAIMIVIFCNIFTMVSFAAIDFSGGLLDGKPLGDDYNVTDNNTSTSYSWNRGFTPAFVFEKPANIIGYRFVGNVTSGVYIHFYVGENKTVVSIRPSNNTGEFVNYTINDVREIRFSNASGFTRYIYEFNVYGTLVEPKPSQVQNVSITDITYNSVSISWDPVTEEILKYKVYLNGEKYGETTGTEYTISDLQPNTTYEVTVTAINEAGEGPASEPLIFTTPELPPEPATKVKNVVIKNMTSTSATISWIPNPETERITKYVIYLNGEKYGEIEGTEYVIEGLKEGEKYIITVAAVNELGEGPPSSPITFTTSKIIDISTTIKVQDILSSIAVLFTNLWPLIAFILAVIAIVPIATALKQSIRRRSDA